MGLQTKSSSAPQRNKEMEGASGTLHGKKGKGHFQSYNPTTVCTVFEMVRALKCPCGLKRPSAEGSWERLGHGLGSQTNFPSLAQSTLTELISLRAALGYITLTIAMTKDVTNELGLLVVDTCQGHDKHVAKERR